ncbi:MAG: YeeE/YedE thiosulfate transporter family protein [Bacteroidia bacterium]|nr:YeeE/YedE thiosulfate transporter family protein [Bacteroidia bacterium]
MKNIAYALVGIVFGITMTKSEAISWYRIIEMFRFESFHMYGIIGVAVGLSALLLFILKRNKFTTLEGGLIEHESMQLRPKRHLLAGSIFGLGWALLGACPGPIYVLIGNGFLIMGVVLIGAVLGTYLYGIWMDKLPH